MNKVFIAWLVLMCIIVASEFEWRSNLRKREDVLIRKEAVYKQAILNACHICESEKIPGTELQRGWTNVNGKCVEMPDIRATFACSACAEDGKTYLDRH